MIYATISKYLLHTILEILETNTSAKKACDRLKSVFHDNQGSHLVDLEHKFTNLKLDNFPNLSAYCQVVKILVTQMNNVDLDITYQRMVLQVVVGLSDNYATIGTHISEAKTLPNFNEARSKLILEEARINRYSSKSEIALESDLHTTTINRESSQSNNRDNQRKRRSPWWWSFELLEQRKRQPPNQLPNLTF
ncbi:uncharacterized protein [Rutidosis leptorrhynchoides]|uniref:uncharacterized protein n=1 Tax=Rutidosis leptorrhynchoides TaxID=125765 RepID=UPI003A9A4B7F